MRPDVNSYIGNRNLLLNSKKYQKITRILTKFVQLAAKF